MICISAEVRSCSPDTISHAFKHYVRAASFDDVKYHSLRHTFAYILKHNGVDLKTIQMLLDHITHSTTAEIYYHVLAGQQ